MHTLTKITNYNACVLFCTELSLFYISNKIVNSSSFKTWHLLHTCIPMMSYNVTVQRWTLKLIVFFI